MFIWKIKFRKRQEYMPREMGSRETQRGASLGNNRETFLCEGK